MNYTTLKNYALKNFFTFVLIFLARVNTTIYKTLNKNVKNPDKNKYLLGIKNKMETDLCYDCTSLLHPVVKLEEHENSFIQVI